MYHTYVCDKNSNYTDKTHRIVINIKHGSYVKLEKKAKDMHLGTGNAIKLILSDFLGDQNE